MFFLERSGPQACLSSAESCQCFNIFLHSVPIRLFSIVTWIALSFLASPVAIKYSSYASQKIFQLVGTSLLQFMCSGAGIWWVAMFAVLNHRWQLHQETKSAGKHCFVGVRVAIHTPNQPTVATSDTMLCPQGWPKYFNNVALKTPNYRFNNTSSMAARWPTAGITGLLEANDIKVYIVTLSTQEFVHVHIFRDDSVQVYKFQLVSASITQHSKWTNFLFLL